MKKLLSLAYVAPLLLIAPAPAQAQAGSCMAQYIEATSNCGGNSACQAQADWNLQNCLQNLVRVDS